MKVVRPQSVLDFKAGDRVIYENPKHPKYTLEGTIVRPYLDEHHLVITDAGHEWVFFTRYLAYISEKE